MLLDRVNVTTLRRKRIIITLSTTMPKLVFYNGRRSFMAIKIHVVNSDLDSHLLKPPNFLILVVFISFYIRRYIPIFTNFLNFIQNYLKKILLSQIFLFQWIQSTTPHPPLNDQNPLSVKKVLLP